MLVLVLVGFFQNVGVILVVNSAGFIFLDLPDKKVLLTNSAQPPAVTLGRAVATREADRFVS